MGPPVLFRFATVILAAGASTRMGQPKMLLPWGTTTVLGHLLSLWKALGADQIAVVTPPGETPVSVELARFPSGNIRRIVNNRPAEGMFSSIQTAARWGEWDANLTHFVLALGDQPQIRKWTLEALLANAQRKPDSIWQLSFQRLPKHPIVLPRNAFESLTTSTCATLRDFLDNSPLPRELAETESAAVNLDLDYPEDYEKVRQQFPPDL